MRKDTPWPYMALFSPLCHSCSHYAVTKMRLKANKLFNPRRLRKKQEKTLYSVLNMLSRFIAGGELFLNSEMSSRLLFTDLKGLVVTLD